MTPMNLNVSRSASQRTQSGAALFVALMLLVILSILGVSIAQVTALQERMANNYRVDDIAFQNADGFLRSREIDIAENINDDRSAYCFPDAAIGGGNKINDWKADATANASAFEALSGEFGAGISSGFQSNAVTAIGDAGAGSWQCLIFRVAAVGVGLDTDDTAARTIVQSTYVLE